MACQVEVRPGGDVHVGTEVAEGLWVHGGTICYHPGRDYARAVFVLDLKPGVDGPVRPVVEPEPEVVAVEYVPPDVTDSDKVEDSLPEDAPFVPLVLAHREPVKRKSVTRKPRK